MEVKFYFYNQAGEQFLHKFNLIIRSIVEVYITFWFELDSSDAMYYDCIRDEMIYVKIVDELGQQIYCGALTNMQEMQHILKTKTRRDLPITRRNNYDKIEL